MNRGIPLILAAAALALSAAAAEREGALEIGVQGGLANYFGDVDGSVWGPAGEVSVDWWIHPQLAFGLKGGWWSLKAEDGPVGFESQVLTLTPRIKWKPLRDHAWNPYLVLGLDNISQDPGYVDDVERNLPNNALHVYNESAVAPMVGLGVEKPLGERWALSLEAQLHQSRSDWMDDLTASDDDDGWFSVLFGLSLRLGQPKDSDGDGILDKVDAAPLDREDFDGFEDEDGAPDLDNDGDGVPDLQDGAPLEAEDLDGFEDGDGVPDLDNDGDGVPDALDAAPMVAEDFDGFQDEDGAPDLDNDGDGIADADDRCPNEPETVNGYQDQDGCPDVKPEVAVEKGQAIVLEGVTFDSARATLTAGSADKLGQVLRTLVENPELEIEIRGYTDSMGSDAGNRRLSLQRAEAVRAWLVERGVDGARVAAMGFGPDSPVADNGTAEGRALNRRIEFFRVN